VRRASTITDAGLQGSFRDLATSRAPQVSYAQNADSTVFLAGDGFTHDASVTFGGTPLLADHVSQRTS
jgi:hypothetical protein